MKLQNLDGTIQIDSGDFPRKVRNRSLWNGKTYGFEEVVIPHKRGPGFSLRYSEPCWRCHGTGHLPEHQSVFNGQCFPCLGTGRLMGRVSLYPPAEAEKRRERRDKKRAADAAAKAERERIEAEAAAQVAAWANLPALPIVREAQDFAIEGDLPEFAQSIIEKAEREPLTLKQIVALEGCVERLKREAERKRTASEVPAGRHQIEGTVLSLKEKHSQFGTTLKLLVEDDRGFRVFGTVPRELLNSKRGDRVRFTATLEPSDRDRLFGFYSRPTKAQRMEEQA